MLLRTRAIVLNTVRYQEKSLIVRCLTREAGIKSYFIHSAFGKGRKISYFQPLTILDVLASHRNKGTLENLREISLGLTYQSIPADIYKSTIAIFLAEVLHHAVREEQPNPPFFDFLETALHWLDTHDETANFHLIAMVQITRFLGFYPDVSNKAESFFDLRDGRFTSHCGTEALSEPETQLFSRLLDLKFGSDQKLFSGTQRQILLRILLDYYAMHLEGFNRPKSVDVLREVFA